MWASVWNAIEQPEIVAVSQFGLCFFKTFPDTVSSAYIHLKSRLWLNHPLPHQLKLLCLMPVEKVSSWLQGKQITQTDTYPVGYKPMSTIPVFLFLCCLESCWTSLAASSSSESRSDMDTVASTVCMYFFSCLQISSWHLFKPLFSVFFFLQYYAKWYKFTRSFCHSVFICVIGNLHGLLHIFHVIGQRIHRD